MLQSGILLPQQLSPTNKQHSAEVSFATLLNRLSKTRRQDPTHCTTKTRRPRDALSYMTSAFEPPSSVVPRYVVTTLNTEKTRSDNHPLESETEDEEVKLNCIGGFRGCDDSDGDSDEDDMNNTTNYSDDSDDYDDDMDRRVGVVNFVARLCKPSPRLIRPAASRRPTLSPFDEEEEEEDEESEVGARGVALAFDDDDDDDESSHSQPAEDDSLSTTSDDSDSEMEHESGSDADESDMEEEDEEEEEELPNEPQEEPTLQRPTLQDAYTPEEETASVILQALEEEDDEEISSLIDSVQGREISPLLEHEHDAHLIGVAQDRQEFLGTVPRVKRVLSMDETMLSQRAPAQEVVLKKRRRSDSHQDLRELAAFSLGPPAMTWLPEPMVEISRFLNPIISSSEELEDENEVPFEDEEEEELDGQLRYELESTASSGGDQSPVPLLTPPESPVLGVETCEWPSNLVVDSAMTAVLTTQIRPLDAWSEVEDETSSFTKGTTPSLLTPLMRGIQVCDP